MRRNIREIKRHLKKVHELAKSIHSPFKGMSLEKAIERMRKVREEVWEEKFAVRS